MYAKPALERFGELRELTLIGVSGGTDGTVVLGQDGCSTFGIEIGCPGAGS